MLVAKRRKTRIAAPGATLTELTAPKERFAGPTIVASAKAEAPDSPEAHKLEGYPLFDWLRFILATAVALGHAKIIGWSQTGIFLSRSSSR